MEWIKAEIEFASAFSYRMPDTSSQFALPMLLPGPSTIKLAIVATAILQHGRVSEGELIFNLVKIAQVKFLLPEKIAVFKPLIKRLKAKKQAPGFEQTFGVRGYVFYSGPMHLFLGLSDASEQDFRKVVATISHLRRLGTSDSLLIIRSIRLQAPEDSAAIVEPIEEITENVNGGIIQRVKDILPNAKLEDVNPFVSTTGKQTAFSDRLYILPLRVIKEGGNWALYERYG